MSDQILRCPHCGKLYIVRSSTTDGKSQSACPKCVDEAEQTMVDYAKENK